MFYAKKKKGGFKDPSFSQLVGVYLIRTVFEVYLMGGQILYHLGMPAIFFYLGVSVKF